MATQGATDQTVESSSSGGLSAVGETIASHERELWAVALVALVGDVVLTYWGLELGLTEANPIARSAIESYGYVALGFLKVGALAIGVVGWFVLPRRVQAVVPLALAIPWSFAVVSNAVMISIIL